VSPPSAASRRSSSAPSAPASRRCSSPPRTARTSRTCRRRSRTVCTSSTSGELQPPPPPSPSPFKGAISATENAPCAFPRRRATGSPSPRRTVSLSRRVTDPVPQPHLGGRPARLARVPVARAGGLRRHREPSVIGGTRGLEGRGPGVCVCPCIVNDCAVLVARGVERFGYVPPFLVLAKYLATAKMQIAMSSFDHISDLGVFGTTLHAPRVTWTSPPGRLASMSNLVSPHGGWRQLSWRLATAFPAHAHVVRLHGVSRRGITYALGRSRPVRR
jgi:hypothetical protein